MAEVLDRPATLRLNPSDPVVVAMRDIAAGETVTAKVKAAEPITRGHKVAILPVAAGEPVRKFGQIIGNATTAIQPGQHVHVHNLAFRPSASDHTIGADRRNTAPLPEAQAATFQGILRPDGSVATRNYIGVLTTVNCSATVARLISDQFRGPQALADFPNVDGIVALTHKSGCARRRRGRSHLAAPPHDRRLCQASELRGRADHRPRLRGQPVEPVVRGRGHPRRRPHPYLHDPGNGRYQRHGARRRRANQATAAGGQQGEAADAAGKAPDARPAMRRLRRFLRHHRQPGARRRLGPAGAERRYGDPERNAGDLRRRAHAAAPRHQQGGRRQAARSPEVVGGLHRQAWRDHGQQPGARQQGRRPDHDPGKVAGRGRQGRLAATWSTSIVTPRP